MAQDLAGNDGWGRVMRFTVVAHLALTGAMAALTLRLTDGALIYSLDDPYIHLAMAEMILRGEYGINAGEAAAASSSALYPVLLAGLLAVGAGALAPLILTSLSGLASLLMLAATARDAGLSAEGPAAAKACVLMAVLALALNAIGLAFTGMEHSLQTALAVAALWGAVRWVRRGKAEAWWLVVLVAQPLIRYEGIGVTVAGALALALRGRPLTGGLVLAGGCAGLLAFAGFLVSQGLPPIPSSVLVKSGASEPGGAWAAVVGGLGRLGAKLTSPHGMMLAAFGVGYGWVWLRRRRAEGPGATAALMAAVVCLGHVLVGQLGWAERYENYALFLAVAAAPVVFAQAAAALLQPAHWGATWAAAAAALIVMTPNVQATVRSPDASRAIHLQQRQMHRIATEVIAAPVAVNDLGWVSFRNDHYVLDLYGLGSERARQVRAAPQGPDWMADLAEAHGVRAAMLYDAWYPVRPEGWARIATLHLLGPRGYVADTQVAIYATAPDDAAGLRARLAAFAPTLPDGARLVLHEPAPAP